MSELDKVEIYFMIDNEAWAFRTGYVVPRVGEKIIFEGILYDIFQIIWYYKEVPHLETRLVAKIYINKSEDNQPLPEPPR